MLAWQSRGMSTAVNIVLSASVAVYAMNALGMDALLIGTLLMVSKIFDGFTDLVAGYIVDNTNTKWGRGRPYEWCVVGLWVCTWLLFSCPTDLSTAGKSAWIFIFYTLANSIFYTFLNANQTVYMIRAFHNEQKYIKLSSIGGLIVTLAVVVFNMIFPSMQNKVMYDAAGWSHLIGVMAIILSVIGMMRFFLVKEEDQSDVKASEGIRFKDVILLMKTNKYLYILMFLFFATTCISNMGVATYYFLYIVRNLDIAGVLSLLAIIIMPTMLLYPRLLKKMTIVQMISRFMCLYFISGIIIWFANDNILMLCIGGLLSGMAALPMSYMSGLLVVDLADYNEWKGISRMEGMLGCVTGFANKVGGAFGTFILGVLLSAAHFVSGADTQPESAMLMIRFIYAWMPVISALITIIVLHFWKLDDIKPQMKKDLEERRAAAAQETVNE